MSNHAHDRSLPGQQPAESRSKFYVKWVSLPNFSQGRYGTYVAPIGRLLRFLQCDTAKRFTGGFFGEQEISIMADPANFEAVANEVIGIAILKLVSVMAAAR